jgi:hypothetical protein
MVVPFGHALTALAQLESGSNLVPHALQVSSMPFPPRVEHPTADLNAQVIHREAREEFLLAAGRDAAAYAGPGGYPKRSGCPLTARG